MKFEFTEKGLESLKKLEKKDIERILKKLKYFQEFEDPLKFSIQIVNEDSLYRFRVGDYRIIVSPNFDKKTIDILTIGHRSVIYKDLNK